MKSLLVRLRDDPKFMQIYHVIMIVVGNFLLAVAYGLF